MKHEIWQETDETSVCTTVLFAGPMGDEARVTLNEGAKLIGVIEGSSHFEAMTKYYEFMGWGKYILAFEEDKNPYPPEWIETQKDL